MSPTRSRPGRRAKAWRFNPEVSGAGLFLDLASHYFDIVDFLAGPITAATGFAINTGGAYAAEDVTVAAFQIGDERLGTGVWNFKRRSRSTRSRYRFQGGS